MGGTKLCLLLMLGTCALAQQEVGNADGQSPTCFLGKRFKNLRRYVYQYEAETLSGVTGATDVKNGPKVSCKVEIDVPQTCSFIVQTTECSLSKVVNMEAGTPVFDSMDAGTFAAAMAKNSLKVTVEGQTDVKLFPEADEPVNILNIKRGIISALVVPVLEEERNKAMATVHGICETVYSVNEAEDIATDVTISRDLSECDSFTAQRDHTSPLALISGMHYPISKMISSTQTCRYNFDNQKKHMTAGSCTEKHIFLPFSHQNEHGVSTEVKQTLTLQETNKINDRVFDHNEANVKFLPMEAAEDRAPVQSMDAVMGAMRELNTLSEHPMGHQRAAIFQRLVSELRGLEIETIRPRALEMMEMSSSLAFQALAQCGTPDCNSALLYILRTFDTSALEVDAAIYALGLLPNPSRLLVKDMLEMAQYKQSKPIMYALSNVVRRLYKAEGVTPEIAAVSEFMASILGADCAGEKELTFLALRVVGNMGDAMEAADAGIKSTLQKCMRQPATTLSVQLAAIQAFRLMSVTGEVRANIQKVSQYGKGAVQKRIAAYLILMRNPEARDLELVKKVFTQEQNAQVKAFVTSHIYNIITSKDPETQELRTKIMDVLQADVSIHGDYTTMSRNFKMGTEQASIGGNIVFDPSSQLPREALLEATLKAFGYNMDIWEIGMEGKGFEPTIELLFGKNGFFPDTISKAMYWTGDKMPIKINEVLEKLASPEGAEGPRKQVPDNIVREIVRNFNKLAKDLQTQESPEAMAYLKIMGAELGYIKGTDFKFIAQNAAMYAEILLKTLPTLAIKNLMSTTENEIFAHYIFMDNKFSLSTASGFPLKFALSGTFAPGAKGGIRISPDMKELSFMPSVGVEFVTQMGVHIPEFYSAAIEMHTNLYHESALNAKITMVEENQVKLSLPAPQGKTQLFRISNRMLTVTSDGATLIPPKDEGRTNVVNCNPLFTGVKYCTTVRYSVAGVNAAAPYFPLNGETKFAVDIESSAEVAEYTATIAYKLLSEGNEGRQKVDSLTMVLKAEPLDDQPAVEATATVKYNRNRHVITTNVQIPDYDVEAGIRVGITDSNARGKSITLEILNKNIPRLSLIGRAKLQAQTDGLLQVQLLIPSLQTDAAITATMNNADQLTMEVKSDIKFLQSSSVQAVTFKYDEEHAEIQMMSNVNSDIKALVPYNEGLQAWLTQLAEDILDQQLIISDMKPRHVVDKALEVGNMWMDKITTDFPYVETLKSSMAELAMPTMPETLFMAVESTLKYQFNKEHMTITIPLPLGGKSSMDLSIPAMFRTPRLTVPVVALVVDSTEIQVPTFTIPSDYDLTLPLMGLVEVSAKVNSNYYNWQGLISAGNNTEAAPSYTAKFQVMADSPIELLSFTSEGTAEISEEETLKVAINGNLKHKLMDTSFGLTETIAILDKVMLTGSCNFQATCPLGMQTSMDITSQCSLDSDMLTGDTTMDGSVTIGHATVSTGFVHTFTVEPVKKEARTESTLRLNSPTLEFLNKIKAGYADEQLLIESDTTMDKDPIKHTTKFSIGYKEAQFTIQSDSTTKAEERTLRSQVDFTASRAETSIRVENQADDTENRAYCLLSGSMNPSGVEINADASLNIFESRAAHKATLTLNENGLATSCTTTAQRSPLTFENVLHGGFDASGSTMAINTKGAIGENTAELNAEGKLGTSEAYLNSVFKSDLFGGNTRNRVSLRLNEDGLTFSNNLVGSFDNLFDGDAVKTDSTHSLTLTLRSLALQSKTDNFFYDNYYKHDITADLGHFTAAVVINSDLKIMGVNFVNEAQYNAEPYKMDLTGSSVGIFSEEEFKHAFEITFVDMTFSAKCNTNGKLLGTQMAHTTDMEIAGLNMKFNSVANFNSPSLRLDSTVKTVAEPFTLNIDALFNSNGAVHLYGEQSGELYSKFLLKAEPLAFTQSFECRASTAHELENGDSIKINIDNKFNSLVTPQEQSVTLKMTSKLNDHTFDQEMNAYNNAEKMGIEVIGAASTNMLNSEGENQDYSISGSVKYDKNNDFFQIPFIEHLPALIEEMKDVVMRLMQDSIQTLREIDSKYDIRGLVKISELRHVIDSFDSDLFVQDLKLFLNSVEGFITTMLSKLPTEEFVNMLRSLMNSIMGWMKSFNFSDKFDVIFSKIEELLSNYEIERIVEAITDEAVEIMKQYQVREKIWAAIAALKSIDIRDLLNKIIAPVSDLVNELYTFDFPQMVDDMSVYFEGLFQKIRSFDYETFTLELKEKLIELSQISCFGKLYGEFRIVSPDYTLRTTAELQNTTTTPLTPEFTVNLNSQATSTIDLLAYTLDASAHIAVPKMNRVSVSENVKAVHTAFNIDHQGTVTLYGLSVQASGKTIAKATSDPYQAELVSDAFFAMASGISATLDTAYSHEINMPLINIFSEAAITQKAAVQVEAGTIRLTINNDGKAKYAIRGYSDEGTHNSDLEVSMDIHTTKVTFTGATNCDHLKMSQNVVADICIFNHVIIDAKAETETPFMTSSIAELKVQAKVEELKIDVTASHNAELVGMIDGTLSNSVVALVTPSELTFDTKNKWNTNLQNDFVITLNSEIQQVSWTGLAGSNLYKYSHHFTMDNGEREIEIFAQMNGEANLDGLKQTITIPEMTVPFVGLRTPAVDGYSLWEDTFLSTLLTTTEQTFEMDAKLTYTKNPNMITIDIDVEQIFDAINTNTVALRKTLLIGKGMVVDVLTDSYEKGKEEYEKYSIEMPKTITVPAYTVPVMNVEVSSFIIPLPDLSLITMPTLHVPSAVSKLTLPKINFPEMHKIMIPAMGDLTYDFSMKTAVIKLKADASIINQGDVVVKIDASSSSEFDVLVGNIEGTATLNRDNGMKLASILSVKHAWVDGNHDSTISITGEAVDASITNSAKVNLPILTMEVNQEMFVNPQEGLIVSVSSPSAGLLGFQVQTKLPVQVKGRLYGRYPSEPTNDVDILAVRSSVNPEKLNIHATWNTELPYEMMLGLKERVPDVVSAESFQEFVSHPIAKTYNAITRLVGILAGSFEQAKEQAKIVVRCVADNFADLNMSDVTTKVSESTMLILREYQKHVQMMLDAAIRFLRETTFQFPGFEEKLSGLEIYQKFTALVADVSEEAIIKVPEFFASKFEAILDCIRSIEFKLPGSSYTVSGREFLVDLSVALKKVQTQIIVIVQKLGDIQLDDTIERLSAFMHNAADKTEELFTSLASQDVEQLFTWVSDVYTDAINSKVLADITEQVQEARRIIEEYIAVIRGNLQDMFAYMSAEQLSADIQSWIDSMVKRLNAFHNKVIEFLKEVTKDAESFVRVSDRQMDIDIPLPFSDYYGVPI